MISCRSAAVLHPALPVGPCDQTGGRHLLVARSLGRGGKLAGVVLSIFLKCKLGEAIFLTFGLKKRLLYGLRNEFLN